MSKVKFLYWVDMLMTLGILILILTGLPRFPGLLAAFGIPMRVLPLALMQALHDWTAVFFAVLVVLHFVLHIPFLAHHTKLLFQGKFGETERRIGKPERRI